MHKISDQRISQSETTNMKMDRVKMSPGNLVKGYIDDDITTAIATIHIGLTTKIVSRTQS